MNLRQQVNSQTGFNGFWCVDDPAWRVKPQGKTQDEIFTALREVPFNLKEDYEEM